MLRKLLTASIAGMVIGTAASLAGALPAAAAPTCLNNRVCLWSGSNYTGSYNLTSNALTLGRCKSDVDGYKSIWNNMPYRLKY